ncbi:MAG: hypothetical protein R6U98_17740, partial [Pirellulaceae bacterium]
MTDHQIRLAAFAFLEEQTARHDELGPDGLLHFRYRGTDPNHRDNLGMKRTMQREAPLIYLFGIVPGEYLPIWPVYTVQGGVRVSAEERLSQPRAANPPCRQARA